jgi:hypothetical protein
MKICPLCQAAYEDDSLVFCLQDGTNLADASTYGQNSQSTENKSNLPLIGAILGGFLLLALIVGGAGLYFFGRGESEKRAREVNNREERGDAVLSNRQTNHSSSVERIETNKTLPLPPSASNSAPPSNVSAQPQIISSASSVRKPDKGNFYFPNFAFDGNPATAWCEGAKGAGEGEWLKFEFDREVALKQIKIQPGYFKSAQSWSDNNRVSAVSIQFSDGTTRKFSFPDQMQQQMLDIESVRTNWVKITIDDYFAGNFDANDTLISEVSFVTEP